MGDDRWISSYHDRDLAAGPPDTPEACTYCHGDGCAECDWTGDDTAPEPEWEPDDDF